MLSQWSCRRPLSMPSPSRTLTPAPRRLLSTTSTEYTACQTAYTSGTRWPIVRVTGGGSRVCARPTGLQRGRGVRVTVRVRVTLGAGFRVRVHIGIGLSSAHMFSLLNTMHPNHLNCERASQGFVAAVRVLHLQQPHLRDCCSGLSLKPNLGPSALARS